MSQNLSSRLSLIKQVQSNKDGHKRNAEDTRKLVKETCLELDRETAIDHSIAALRYAISDLIGIAADDTKADYLMVNRSHLETDLKRLEILCSGLRAVHIKSLSEAAE